MDKGVFGFLGVDGERAARRDQERAERVRDRGVPQAVRRQEVAAEIKAFNDEFLSHGPQAGSDGEKYFLNMRNDVAPDRTDVTTWPDLLDLDEKRDVPQRVGV